MEKDPLRSPPRNGSGRITAVEWETVGTVKRAAVYVDDRFAVYALPPEAQTLVPGEAIHPGQLTALQARYERGAYLQAVRLLARRDRSVREVQRHLETKGWDEPARERAVARLQREGFLEDQAFARKWVDYRSRNAPRSRRVMIRELEQKGIARETIRDAVAAMDESALALACARRKRRQWRRFRGEERLQRIMVFLQRKGFPYRICRETAGRMADDGQDD